MGVFLSDKEIAQNVISRVKSKRFAYGNDIHLTPKEYLKNIDAIEFTIKENLSLNHIRKELITERNELIKMKANDIRDKAMFGNEQEAFNLLNQFEKFEV